MNLKINFSLDHFGVVSQGLFNQLLNQSGDKRKRKTALHAIARMCKTYKLIPESSTITSIGLMTDAAGQITYEVQYESSKAQSGPSVLPPAPSSNTAPSEAAQGGSIPVNGGLQEGDREGASAGAGTTTPVEFNCIGCGFRHDENYKDCVWNKDMG